MTTVPSSEPTVASARLPAALVALGVTALLAAPLGVGRFYSAYYLNLVTWILIFSLFAAALDLALGYGGLVSFGHAGFFGTGAYAAALTLRHLSTSFWLPLLLGQVQSFGVALLPTFHTPLVFLVMAVVLVLRPAGLFGAPPRQ